MYHPKRDTFFAAIILVFAALIFGSTMTPEPRDKVVKCSKTIMKCWWE